MSGKLNGRQEDMLKRLQLWGLYIAADRSEVNTLCALRRKGLVAYFGSVEAWRIRDAGRRALASTREGGC
jgi:hypothetical protein